MSKLFNLSMALFMALLFSITTNAADRPPQYIHLAFDGSKSLNMWKTTRDFAKANNVRFSYFISGVYFLSNAHRNNYVEPAKGKGKSAIGFGGNSASIAARVAQIKAALDEGHEIASHANGHFDGSKYTQNQWNRELAQFKSIMAGSWGKYASTSTKPAWWEDFFKNNIAGFRAPQLGRGKGLWPALVNHGYAYDTSRIDKMNYWPRIVNGVWNFPLASVRIHGMGKKTISMDYNFYFAQSKAKKGPASKHKIYEEQMFRTYMNYFNNNYKGNRAPMHIGHHFSLWNGGAYWKAMKRFAIAVCNKPEVICGTYQELVEFLNLKGRPQIAEYQRSNFKKMNEGVESNHELSPFRSFGAPTMSYDMNINDQDVEDLRAQSHDHFKAHEE